METIVLTDAQFDALPEYSGEVITDGFTFKKKFLDGYIWMKRTGLVMEEKLIDCPFLRQPTNEQRGLKCKRNIWKAMAPLSDTNKATLVNMIAGVLIALGDGEISAALTIANGLTVQAPLTAQRKADLIALIQSS